MVGMRLFGWILVAVALAGCGSAAREGISRDHEAALERYLSASRTLVVVRESDIPQAIREGAVERWGFDAGSLDAARVARIRSYGDEAALLDYVTALHFRNLNVHELHYAAEFLETGAGRDMLSGKILSPADKQRYVEFMQSPIGARIEEFDGFLSRELPRALLDYADKAMEIYVRESGLPNRRKADAKP